MFFFLILRDAPAPGYVHKSRNRNYAIRSTHASCHFVVCAVARGTFDRGTSQFMFPLQEYELAASCDTFST